MEMPGPWKAWKSKSSFSPLFTAPWESRQRREIPTFPQPGIAPDGKVENQNQVSHFPPRGMRRRPRFVCFQNQKPRKEIGRFAASSITFFRITLDWKRNSVSGSSFDWKMLDAKLPKLAKLTDFDRQILLIWSDFVLADASE